MADLPHSLIEDASAYQKWVDTRVGGLDRFCDLIQSMDRTQLRALAGKLLFALGLAGECGEVVDLIKKEVFHGKPVPREKYVEEMGDVRWYLTHGYTVNQTTDAEVRAYNVDKLVARDGANNERFHERAMK